MTPSPDCGFPALENHPNDPRSLPPGQWLTDGMLPLKG